MNSLHTILPPSYLLPICSTAMERMLELVGECWLLTDGLFDPTVLPLLTLWKTKLESGCCPKESDIFAAKNAMVSCSSMIIHSLSS